MRTLTTIIAIIIITTAQAQINSTTGQITGSDQSSVKLRQKKQGNTTTINYRKIKGTIYYNPIPTKATSGDGTTSAKYNAYTGEIEIGIDVILLPEAGAVTFENGDVFVPVNGRYLLKIKDNFFVDIIKKYDEGRKAVSSMERDIEPSFKTKKEYYEFNNGQYTKLKRKAIKMNNLK